MLVRCLCSLGEHVSTNHGTFSFQVIDAGCSDLIGRACLFRMFGEENEPNTPIMFSPGRSAFLNRPLEPCQPTCAVCHITSAWPGGNKKVVIARPAGHS